MKKINDVIYQIQKTPNGKHGAFLSAPFNNDNNDMQEKVIITDYKLSFETSWWRMKALDELDLEWPAKTYRLVHNVNRIFSCTQCSS